MNCAFECVNLKKNFRLHFNKDTIHKFHIIFRPVARIVKTRRQTPLPTIFSPLFLSPPFHLEVGPLKSSEGVWGSAVSSLSRALGEAPAEIEFGAF